MQLYVPARFFFPLWTSLPWHWLGIFYLPPDRHQTIYVVKKEGRRQLLHKTEVENVRSINVSLRVFVQETSSPASSPKLCPLIQIGLLSSK
eukprot:scaffold7642_cov96-Skeletonema_marinoi.AAC.2